MTEEQRSTNRFITALAEAPTEEEQQMEWRRQAERDARSESVKKLYAWLVAIGRNTPSIDDYWRAQSARFSAEASGDRDYQAQLCREKEATELKTIFRTLSESAAHAINATDHETRTEELLDYSETAKWLANCLESGIDAESAEIVTEALPRPSR